MKAALLLLVYLTHRQFLTALTADDPQPTVSKGHRLFSCFLFNGSN